MTIRCTGRGDASGDHCCWVAGKVCDFLIDGIDGHKFACALRTELGSWSKVHADPRYEPIKVVMLLGDGLCGDWMPAPNVCCNEAR